MELHVSVHIRRSRLADAVLIDEVTNICKPVTSDDPEAWGRPFDLRAAEFVESAMALQQLQPAFGAFLRSLELDQPPQPTPFGRH